MQNLAKHVRFPFFEKAFIIKLLVQASFQCCIMDNIYKKHFFTGALKNLFEIFVTVLEKNPRWSSRSQVSKR